MGRLRGLGFEVEAEAEVEVDGGGTEALDVTLGTQFKSSKALKDRGGREMEEPGRSGMRTTLGSRDDFVDVSYSSTAYLTAMRTDHYIRIKS